MSLSSRYHCLGHTVVIIMILLVPSGETLWYPCMISLCFGILGGRFPATDLVVVVVVVVVAVVVVAAAAVIAVGRLPVLLVAVVVIVSGSRLRLHS